MRGATVCTGVQELCVRAKLMHASLHPHVQSGTQLTWSPECEDQTVYTHDAHAHVYVCVSCMPVHSKDWVGTEPLLCACL